MPEIGPNEFRLATRLAAQFARRLPAAYRSRIRDDLESDALFALVQASHDYDGERFSGVPFLAFATQVIKWRLLDSWRVACGRHGVTGNAMPLVMASEDVDPSAVIEFLLGPALDPELKEAEYNVAVAQFLRLLRRYAAVNYTDRECWILEQRIAGRSLDSIAGKLGITESRVSQIMAALLQDLAQAGFQKL